MRTGPRFQFSYPPLPNLPPLLLYLLYLQSRSLSLSVRTRAASILTITIELAVMIFRIATTVVITLAIIFTMIAVLLYVVLARFAFPVFHTLIAIIVPILAAIAMSERNAPNLLCIGWSDRCHRSNERQQRKTRNKNFSHRWCISNWPASPLLAPWPDNRMPLLAGL
jgi:hypothetical protein